MSTENQAVKEAKGKIPLWRIAKKVGVHEMTVIRWMREEMDEEKKARVLSAIAEVKTEMVQLLVGKEAVQ
jgi:transposase-like protein